MRSYIIKAFGSSSAQRIELWQNDHAQLGSETLHKFHSLLPELALEEWARPGGLLWWILHNQEEAVFRLEKCRETLSSLIEANIVDEVQLSNRIALLLAALDELKQKLTFLVGELEANSFYSVDGSLETICFDPSQIHKLKTNEILDEKESRTVESFESFGDALQAKVSALIKDGKSISHFTRSTVELLTTGDRYCHTLKRFSSEGLSSIAMFCLFRQVTADGMDLLAQTLRTETATRLLRFYNP